MNNNSLLNLDKSIGRVIIIIVLTHLLLIIKTSPHLPLTLSPLQTTEVDPIQWIEVSNQCLKGQSYKQSNSK